MDTRKHMIIIKGQVRTSEIRYCKYNAYTKRMDIEFTNGRQYSYSYNNVEWLKEPKILNPNMYRISRQGNEIINIKDIYVFRGAYDTYWHICFYDGRESDYSQKELNIVESCLGKERASNVFEYIKQVATLNELKNEKTGEKLLVKKFNDISFIGNDVALAKYLEPALLSNDKSESEYIPIFPFGCNNSQYKAVKNATENQISVIEGPPGTGKTQTILNIISNIIMQGKTVQVVSNNNSAIDNVYEKLSSPKYNLGFIVATLGSTSNKKKFIEQQSTKYPDFEFWKIEKGKRDLQKDILEKSIQLKNVFDKEERLAYLRNEQSQLTTEIKYFNEYINKLNISNDSIITRKKLSSNNWMAIWQECQMLLEKKQKIGILFKIKAFLKYGVSDLDLYKYDPVKIIALFQSMYYHAKQIELNKEVEEIEKSLASTDKDLLDDLCNQSMVLLKDKLARKYEKRRERRIFTEKDLWERPHDVLEEYPVILSTTFSARNSLNKDVVYDYIIIDEASQVDVVTGALVLSCARNVVVVGDTKQLPNVITDDAAKKAKVIFDRFDIDEGYQFTKSFLQSVLDVMPNVAHTLLREHYRCHPKIINFCNQKFYRGELIIMTEDKGEDNVLTVIKTVPGNHMRNHYSQRQIDVINNEIVSRYVSNCEETGIIAPYKNQVEAIRREIKDIDIATVHKFEGREKDTIIISTVDDQISDFVDDPYLINVVVSRAKKKLILIVTGNEQEKDRNITDLIDYIQYNNFEVSNSKTYSIFDYLYKQYSEERKKYLHNHKRISKYDSENIMYSLIVDILAKEKYASLDVVCHFPMNMLIKNLELLDEREYQYVINPATHIDFLLYNRISKKPMLAIEVDGYDYHKENTVQASRDLLKNHILEIYKLPLLRFITNGSGEKEKIIEVLDKLVS